jgi:hypothetical protein
MYRSIIVNLMSYVIIASQVGGRYHCEETSMVVTNKNTRTCPNPLCDNYGGDIPPGERCPICSTPVWSPIPVYNRLPPYVSRLFLIPLRVALVIAVIAGVFWGGSTALHQYNVGQQTQAYWNLATLTQVSLEGIQTQAQIDATYNKAAEYSSGTATAAAVALLPSPTPITPSPTPNVTLTLTPSETFTTTWTPSYTPSWTPTLTPTFTPTDTATPIDSIYTLQITSLKADEFVTVGFQSGLFTDTQDDIRLKYALIRSLNGSPFSQSAEADLIFTDQSREYNNLSTIQLTSVPWQAQIQVCFLLIINPKDSSANIDGNKQIDGEKCLSLPDSAFQNGLAQGSVTFTGSASISPRHVQSRYELAYSVTRN